MHVLKMNYRKLVPIDAFVNLIYKKEIGKFPVHMAAKTAYLKMLEPKVVVTTIADVPNSYGVWDWTKSYKR